jgi:hypothetical protein
LHGPCVEGDRKCSYEGGEDSHGFPCCQWGRLHAGIPQGWLRVQPQDHVVRPRLRGVATGYHPNPSNPFWPQLM